MWVGGQEVERELVDLVTLVNLGNVTTNVEMCQKVGVSDKERPAEWRGKSVGDISWDGKGLGDK